MKQETAIKITSALALCFLRMQGAVGTLLEARARTAAEATIAQHQTAIEVVEAINESKRQGNESPLSHYAYVSPQMVPAVHQWAVSNIQHIDQLREKEGQ